MSLRAFLFYFFNKMRVIRKVIQALTGSPAARGVTSDPQPADQPNRWNLALSKGTGHKLGPAVGKGLLPHHTRMAIPGEYWPSAVVLFWPPGSRVRACQAVPLARHRHCHRKSTVNYTFARELVQEGHSSRLAIVPRCAQGIAWEWPRRQPTLQQPTHVA